MGSRHRLRFVSVDSVGEAPGVECSFRQIARHHVTHRKTAQHMFQTVSIPSWLNKRWSRLVAEQFGVRCAEPVTERISQPLRQFHSFIAPGVTAERETMDESVYCRPGRGDSGLVASELSIKGTRWKFVLLALGCGLFFGACANDSADDDSGGAHRHHRHGNGHAREHTETIDRSDNPSPTPALGW